MNRTTELIATAAAGATGAAIAVVAVGASFLLVLPATIGIAAIAAMALPRSD